MSAPADDRRGARDRVARYVPGIAMFDGYRGDRLRIDVVAAVSLWAVAVPQSLAYGELAGLPAVAGLYTALAGMLLYGLFGSSRYLNVGPESASAIVVAASIAPLSGADPQRAIELTAMLAVLTGGFLLVGAIVRLGPIRRLLSTPILSAYLTGSAIIIIASQIPKILGISVEGHQWWRKIGQTVTNIDETNLWALAIGLGTIVLVIGLRRYAKALPAFLIALVLATVVVAAADLAAKHGVAIVGHIPRGIPLPRVPRVSFRDTVALLGPAVSMAVLVFANSVATAQALAARDREDVDPNKEFVGLAVAGFGAGLIRGFPANASDSRSFIVAGSRARSQTVNLFGAVAIAITLLALTPLFHDLPISALAAVILVSATKLIDVAGFRRLWRIRRSDFALAIVTFAGVLVFGVLPGIGVGVAVSLLETMRRAVLPRTAVLGHIAGTPTFRDITYHEDAEIVPGLIVYRFDAPLFFANAEVFRNEIRQLVHDARHPVVQVIVSAEGITDMDVTGGEMVGRLLDDLDDTGVRFTMARLRTKVQMTLARLGLEERIGPENIFLTVADAARGFGGAPGRAGGAGAAIADPPQVDADEGDPHGP
jgi:SulP family sulfate permease